MPTTGVPKTAPSMGRYDSSVAGWSAVDKVAQFSHAVGRVSGGRGSAILIALIDSQGQLIDPAADPISSRIGGSPRTAPTQPLKAGSLRFNARSSHDSFRSAFAGSVTSLERTGREGNSRRVRDMKQMPLGVLLTTSHVLSTPEEAEEATVTFLDQLGLMTVASLGYDSQPMRVPLRGAYGFVTSSTGVNEHNARYRHGVARGRDRHRRGSDGSRSCDRSGSWRRPDADLDEPDYLLYRCQDTSDEEATDDVGFTLTFCDIFPLPTETASSASPHTPSLRSSGRGYDGSGSSAAHPISSSHLDEGNTSVSPGQRSAVSEVGTAYTAASRSGAPSARRNLLLVQPLPVPLLLSTIPDVKVGDAHLIITHASNGRRCYRVHHVAVVYPDYCEYKLDNASEDESSGGPVFNSAGDFVGIQHERHGHSICLLMKSIVRNLFASDLLGMCRSPISEASVKKREPHVRAGVPAAGPVANTSIEMATMGNGVYSPKMSFKRSERSFRTNSLAETPAASLRTGIATNVGGGGSGGDFDTVASAAGPSALSALPPSTSRKPLSQEVPGYEAVFEEFYSGFDSLSHILYAFPHSRQLLKLALENLSQMKYSNGLDQMSTIGGVGAILETIDGYPQDEAIVSGALAAMCRICIYERNLAMFLHLDGVVTTMEIMKEYVHQPTVLQWGMYLLVTATDAAAVSAAQCAEMIVQSRGPQLFVNVLRVHGKVQRKSAVRHLQHNRLVRWTCDLIANLLVSDPLCSTLFLREDFLAVLLQLLFDYAGNLFLTEGLVHVFCVFVRCFADMDGDDDTHICDAQHVGAVMPGLPGSREPPLPSCSQTFLSPTDRLVNAQVSVVGSILHFARAGFASPYAVATNPHKVSFFFLCQIVASDTDNCFLRSLLEICEAAMDTKNAVTAHRGRPEGVLLQCITTLRLLLSWGLVHLHRRIRSGEHAAPGTEISFSSLGELPTTPSVTSSSLQMPAPSDELLRLRVILSAIRATMASSYELQMQLSAVERLMQQQE
jgi:hypothetical protein